MLPWESLSLVSLIFSKLVGTSMDSLATIGLSGFFNCPLDSICWIGFGPASNYFCLLKSTAINLLIFDIVVA